MTDDPPLLPCPFCGSEAHFEQWADCSIYPEKKGQWSVACLHSYSPDEGCLGAQLIASFDHKVEAAKAWNKRAPGARS